MALNLKTPEQIKEQIALEFTRLTLDEKVVLAKESGIIALFPSEMDMLNSAMGSFVLARTYEATRAIQLLGSLSDVIRIVPAVVQEEAPKRKYTKRMTRTASEEQFKDPNQTDLLVPVTQPAKHGFVRGVPVLEETADDTFSNFMPRNAVGEQVPVPTPVEAEESEEVDPFDNLFQEGRVRPTEEMQFTSSEGVPIGEMVSKEFGTKGDLLDPETFGGETIAREEVVPVSEPAPVQDEGTLVALNFDDESDTQAPAGEFSDEEFVDESPVVIPVAPVQDEESVHVPVERPADDSVVVDPFAELPTTPVTTDAVTSSEDPFANI